MNRTLQIVAFLAFATALSYAQKVIRVPQDSAKIQAAINGAANGDTVLVSEGTYFENIRYNGKKIVVASLYARDKDTTHISRTIIDGSQPLSQDSASTVWFNGATDTNSVIIGFTIRGGKGTRQTFTTAPQEWRYGGGVAVGRWFDTTTHGATIKNNIIRENLMTGVYPGGPYSEGCGIAAYPGRGFLIVEDNRVVQNTIDGPMGGGMVFSTCVSCRIVRNLIQNNSANGATVGFSGGISFNGVASNDYTTERKLWTAIIRENTIKENFINPGHGGGISVFGDSAYAMIQNNFISGNYANGSGGGIRVGGGARTLIANNTITKNHSTVVGGGLDLYNHSKATLASNYISGNSAGNGGGGIFVRVYTQARLENNIVTRNTATMFGGGLCVEVLSTADVVNNTFTGNKADTGGAVSLWDSANVRLMNNIFWGDSAVVGGEFYFWPQGTGVRLSIASSANNLVTGLSGGTGNFTGDPKFVVRDTLHRLADSSIAIGKGIASTTVEGVLLVAPFTDYLGLARPRSSTSKPDLGAIENDRDSTLTSVQEMSAQVPIAYDMWDNYPNPFNPSTTIRYALKEASTVRLVVYDVLGREVAVLVNERQAAGIWNATWETDMPSGTYFGRLEAKGADGQVVLLTKKMLLVR